MDGRCHGAMSQYDTEQSDRNENYSQNHVNIYQLIRGDQIRLNMQNIATFSDAQFKLISDELNRCFPDLDGAYLFGSGASNELRNDSDLDFAILQPAPLDANFVIEFKAFVSQSLRRDCDVVDLRAADTVTAAQVVVNGRTLTESNPLVVANFETMALSRYALLNEERSEILNDIQTTGTIHGR